MSRYILKPSSDSVFFIRYQGKNIGSVQKRAVNTREWVAKIGTLTKYAPTAKEAFYEVVAARNRIDLCGEDDHVKARQALDKRNAQAEREARAFEPVMELARQLGLSTPRRRSRKIRI